MAEQVTDPPAGGTVVDLGKKVKAKYPQYANLSDEEVGRKVKAKYPDAYGDFTDTPSFQPAPQPMTTPLPGAAAGPSIGSGTQQVASPTPSPTQQPQFDAAGEALASGGSLEPEPLTEVDRQAYLRSLAGEPDSVTPARVRNAILDRNAASRAVGQEYTVPSGTAGIYTRNAGLPIGTPDERDEAIRYDYAKSLGMRNELGVMRDITDRLNAGADSGLDRYAKFQFDALDHASTKLEGRANRVYALLDQGVPPEQLQSEIADIQDAEGYLQERRKWLVQNLPKSETQRIIEQRQKEAQEYEKERGVGGTIREGARITGIGFGESLLSGAAGLARTAAELTGTSDGYDWSDKFSDFADATVRKQTAYLPPEWSDPLSQVVEQEQPDGTKKSIEKYNIMPTLLRGAGGMGGLVVGAGATGRVGSLLGKLTGRGIAATGAVNPLGAATLTDAAMGVGAQGGRTAGMFFPEFDGQMRRAIDAGANESAAVLPAAAYALASAMIEEFNPQAYIKVPGLKSQLQKGFVDAIKDGVPANAKMLITHVAKKAGNEGLKEALETAAQKGSEIAANRVTNAISGSTLDEDVSARDFVNEVAGAFVLGSAFGTAAHAGDGKKMRQTTAEAIRFAAENPAAVEQMIATQIPPAEQDKFKERLDRLAKIYKGNNLSDLPTKKGATVASLVTEKQDIEKAIKEAPMDPSVEAAVGDPRKRKAAELTTAMIEAMGIPADKAKAALIGAGMEKAPEGTKAVTNPDGSVTLEKKPEAGEKKKAPTAKKEPTSKAVESVFSADEATGEEETTGVPTGVPEGVGAVTPEAPLEPTTNEDQLATEAPAAAQATDTDPASGVPVGERPAAEPVAKPISQRQKERDRKAEQEKVLKDASNVVAFDLGASGLAIRYLAGGGKVNTQSLIDELGLRDNNGKVKQKEFRGKVWAHDNKSKSIEAIADKIAEENDGIDAAEVRTELISALRDMRGRNFAIDALRDYLPKTFDEKEREFMARQAEDADVAESVDVLHDVDPEEVDAMMDAARAEWASYTPEQKQVIFDERDAAEAAYTEALSGPVPGEAGNTVPRSQDGQDAEEHRLAAEAKRARAERDRFVADWNERGQGLFAPEEGMAQQTIDGGFDNSQENFDARVEPLNERVRQADKALADYVNSAASRVRAAAQQTSIPTGSAEAAARKAAAILEKAKLKGDQLYALPLPPSVWNGAIRAMQEVIIAGGKAADAIAAAIKHIQDSDWWKNKATQKEKDEVTSHLKNKQDALEAAIAAEAKAEEPPPAPKAKSEPSGPKEVKKTFTTKRAYEGEFRDEVKAELAKGGLTREVENKEEARERGDAIIAKIGIDAALDAAKAGDVRGGARSAIIVRALEDIKRKMDTPGTTQEEMTRLAIEQSDLIQWHSQELTEAGREASMMDLLYQESDLGFTVAARTSDWKKKTGEEPSEEQIKRWKEVEAEMEVWKQKWAEAEKRAEEAEAAATMKALQEFVARQKSVNRKTTPAQRSKVLADKIRTLKIGQRGVMSATIVPPQVWDGAVEAVAQAMEATGKLATAIQAGLQKIRESDWYKKLRKDEQEDSEASFTSAVNEAMADDVESGPIRIPKQMIREAVANGAKDIDALVATIKEQLTETYPDATDRQIRDAITEYGKVVNLNKDELSAEVRRIKRIGRIVSALEDVANQKRPLRSGLQRDKLDAEERALNKELREAMKDLPVDAEAQARELRTALDAAKTRARNRIEDLQREIDTRQRTPRSTTRIEPDAELEALIAEKEELEKEHDAIFGDKSLTEEERLKRVIDATRRSVEALEQKVRDKNVDPAKPQSVPETPELKALRQRREKLREEYRRLQEEAGVITRRKLDTAKKAAKARIQELERRIDQGDFSKKEAKPPVTDNELIRLQAEKMRLKEEYDKEFYKHKLLNRTMPERAKDAAWEFWGLTRALRATGELSFVLMQGGALTVSNLWHKPGAVGRAFKTMWQAMRSEKKSEEWLRKVKSQDWYPMAKEAKLAITEPHAELSAREELFMSDWTKIIWNVLGSPLKLASKKAYEVWAAANPMRAIERGASGYLDTLRIERFMDGMEMIRKNTGAPPSKEELKDIADVANTLTGRASIGKLEPIANTLTKLFFSPRLWASAIKTGTPYAFIHFGKMTPTARKMAVQDLGRYLGTTMGLVALAATYFNNDDDDETGVETDPRSADFGKIKIGNKYIDPWGGRIQQLVFSTRMTIGLMSLLKDEPLDAYKDRKTGEATPLGQGMTPTMMETAMRMAQNKLAPSAGIIAEAMGTKVRKDGTRTSFGKEYGLSDELVGSLYPIYWETVKDLAKEDPGALEGFLMFYAFFGGGVNVDEPKAAAGRQERVRPERPEPPEPKER